MTRHIPYADIGLALENTINSLEIIKEIENWESDVYIAVGTYGGQPPTNMDYIGIGFVNDRGVHKEDTFDSDAREYVFQVSVMFKRLGESQLDLVEKLSSLFSPLLKYAFRMSDEMICKIHKRDEHGDIAVDEEGKVIVYDTVDLREILKITDIMPVFGQPQGDGLLMYLKFDVEEDDLDMTKEECFRITQNIKEVLVNVKEQRQKEEVRNLRGYGYSKR